MRIGRFALSLVLTVALGGAALAGALALLVPAGRSLASSTTALPKLDADVQAPPERSYVYDRYGNVMTTLFAEDRSPVKLKDVPQVLIDAVLAIEDRRFYEHNGVDWGGTLRALFKNVDAGGVTQGGSTITQQLVKNTLGERRERDLKTKAREAILAIRLEGELSKDEILDRYLNVVYFGNGAYGVQAAAERYFDEPLQKLTIPQAALLAGLIQSPEALNPITHPDSAARRRAEVLDAMVTTHKITAEQAHEARSVPLPTKVQNPLLAKRDYFMDEVVRRLLGADRDLAESLGSTVSARYNAVFRGGLKIYTTYDPALQLAASGAVAATLPREQPQFTAALVVIDNKDGGVRAIVAGRNYDQSKYNLATQGRRQAGSAFKGITLAAALDSGYSPNDNVDANSLRWKLGPGNNYYNLIVGKDDCHGGSPTLTRAIAISDNCAFVRTELSLGPGHYGADGAQKVVNMAKRLGIDTSGFSPVVSTTLGTNGVSPLDMAQAYSVLAQDGIRRNGFFVSKIVGPDGKVIFEQQVRGDRVLPPNVARTETQMLTHVISEGTARNNGNIGRPAAGKTGTTDDHADAWFIGYTPQYTAAVWMGNPDRREAMDRVGGIAVFGGTYPTRIWAAFMKAAVANDPAVDFAAPDPAQWPTPQYVDESGREYSTRYARPAPDTTPSTPPTSGGPTTRPSATTATTSATTTPSTGPPTTKKKGGGP